MDFDQPQSLTTGVKVKWMIHPTTHMVMAYNKQLVDEMNFRPYDGPLPVIDPKLGYRVMNDDAEFETEQTLAQKDKEEKEKLVFSKHVFRIVEALKEMKPHEFITANGMPKLKSIEKIVGFMPTMEERTEAFEKYQDWKAEEKMKSEDEPKSVAEMVQ